VQIKELARFPPKLAPYPWNDYVLKVYKKLVPGIPEIYKELVTKSLEEPDYLENYLETSFEKMKQTSESVIEKYNKLSGKRGINEEYYKSIKNLMIEHETADFLYYWLPLFAMGEGAFSEYLYEETEKILGKENLRGHFSEILKVKSHANVRAARRHAKIMDLLEKHKDLKKAFEEKFSSLKTVNIRVADVNLKEIFSELLLEELSRREPEAGEILEWLKTSKEKKLFLSLSPQTMSGFLERKPESKEQAESRIKELEARMQPENAKKLALLRKNLAILQKYRDIFSEQYYKTTWIEVVLEAELRAISGKGILEIILEE